MTQTPETSKPPTSGEPKDFAGDLILGCGFLGSRLADHLLKIQPGHAVHTVTRSNDKAEHLREIGLQVIVGDIQLPEVQSQLLSAGPFRSITVCVANDSKSQSHSEVYLAAVRLAISLVGSDEDSGTRINFVSTTGVYAAVESDVWVDETTATAPVRPGSVASLECEKLLRQAVPGRYCVFRLAGIYHQDRIPNLAKLKTGETLVGSGDGWLNLIHVDDAAEILAEAIIQPPNFSLANVSDGNPILRRDFYQQIAKQLNLPAPQFEQSGQPGEAGRGGSKRICNQRLLQWWDRPLRQVSDAENWH